MKMKITKKLIKQIENEAKKYFQKASGCHDWTHVERVRALALKIGKKEKADSGVLELAALLHDIGRCEEMQSKGKICHAEKGSELADKILINYGLSQEVIQNIKHCIITHRHLNSYEPDTIEAKVLYDADKLDSIGAVGIARDFVFAGYIGSLLKYNKPLYTGNEKKFAGSKKDYSYTKEDSALLEYEIKLKHVKNKLLTKEGKKIGKERHRFMEQFFKRFWQEVRAEK